MSQRRDFEEVFEEVGQDKKSQQENCDPDYGRGRQYFVEDETAKKTASKKVGHKRKAGPKTAEVDDRDDATIKKHAYSKEEELTKVWVTWKPSNKSEWMYLHDMWVDYPEELKKYRKEQQLKGKAWRVPNLKDVSFVVRILSMNGTGKMASFCLLFDNGYVEEEVDLDVLCARVAK